MSESQLPHSWLRKLPVVYLPGPETSLMKEFSRRLLEDMQALGHTLLADPRDGAEIILTTAAYGQPVNWRNALMMTARKRYRLDKTPVTFTFVQMRPAEYQAALAHFEKALAKNPADPDDFRFPGMTGRAYHTLYEQGRRGGPILSLVRLLQSQAMCVRVILVIGEDRPVEAYTFDLVGAHPRSPAEDPQFFYRDLALRITTAASTQEIISHQVSGDIIPNSDWKSLTTPQEMIRAGLELGKRSFFTEMVQVSNLVHAPAIHESVSRQYSEGCYSTWEPRLNALIATITGSARPVEKDHLTENELAVISGVRLDGLGACVRLVEGKRNDPPSSEAVEMIDMDSVLPQVWLGPDWEVSAQAPVARSKLHGHRGVRAYDPKMVEHVWLDRPFYDYPVSCSTEAQAWAIKAAFARSEALQNPADPRQIVFTVLPGHGIVIVEKWAPGKSSFQVIWEAMDSGALEIDNHVPQGQFRYEPGEQGKWVIRLLS